MQNKHQEALEAARKELQAEKEKAVSLAELVAPKPTVPAANDPGLLEVRESGYHHTSLIRDDEMHERVHELSKSLGWGEIGCPCPDLVATNSITNNT